MRPKALHVGSLAGGVGAALASMAASLCCIGPLALTLLGVNGMILAAGVKPYRWYLMGVSAFLLGVAFWAAYRPPERVSTAACPRQSGRVSKVILWMSALVWLGAGILQFAGPLV